MTSIKRVLLSINVRWWNAEAAYAINLAKGLVKQGISVWIIVNRDSPVHHRAVEQNLNVITDVQLDSLNPIKQLINLYRIKKHIDKNEIQLVNSFKSNGAFNFSLLRWFRKGIVYIKTRGIATPPKQNVVNRFLYGPTCCDGIVAVGSTVGSWIEKLLGTTSNQKVEIIHYGDLPVPVLSPPKNSTLKEQLSIQPNSKLLALLGRTQHIKGHLILLKALLDFEPGLFHLLFLVKDLEEFPEENEKITAFIEENDLQKHVSILGFQNNLGNVLSQVDCGVIPSIDSEVNCRVCVEFFSLGIPVISFPTGTLPDLVKHRQVGYLCEDKSSKELVKAMNWLLNEPDQVAITGKNALKEYKDNYSLEKFTNKTLDFYNKCKRA